MGYRFMCYPGGVRKAVTFSYDDGSTDDIKLIDSFNQYNLKATLNINSDRLLNGSGISLSDAKRFLKDGHEIAVHGKFHKANGISRPIDGIRDVLLCREELENSLGKIIRGMAYPDTGITNFANGTDYETVKRYLADLGIVYSRTLGGDNNSFSLPDDWYCWMPTVHHNNKNIFSYIDDFISLDLENNYHAMRHPRLFYVWGHSFEFASESSWEHLDKICSLLGNREDVWYATNIEIYDYVNAYNSLISSADGKIIYNPTLYDIWFAEGSKRYCAASGQSLVIDEE